MKPEELKAILEAIERLSGNASDAFAWWLVANYGSKLIGDLLLVSLLGGVVVFVYLAIKRRSEVDEADSRYRQDHDAYEALLLRIKSKKLDRTSVYLGVGDRMTYGAELEKIVAEWEKS